MIGLAPPVPALHSIMRSVVHAAGHVAAQGPAHAAGAGPEVSSRVTRLRQITESLGSGSTLSVGWIIVAAGGLLVVLSIVSAVKWWRDRHRRPHPLVVFNQVAAEVGLSLPDQALLYRIAVHEKLPTPLTLMLSPRTLRHHAKGYLRRVKPWRRRRCRRRLVAIRRSLFGRHAPHAASPHEALAADVPPAAHEPTPGLNQAQGAA